jgi:hypothetical protein
MAGKVTYKEHFDQWHQKFVHQAVSEGKPVPRHVLEEYKSEPWAQEALAEPEAPKAKRLISKEAYEQAKKSLLDKGTLRAGVSPKDFADFATIGAYHIESGLRTFGNWSKQMIQEFGEKVKPHLKRIWKESNKAVKLGPIEQRNALIKQIHTIKSQKGLTDKQYKELKQKVTETGQAKSAKNMSLSELEALLTKMKRARPRTVGQKTVITAKTERQIAELKGNLTEKLQMTDEAFAEILQREVHGKQPKFIDAKTFITQTEGRAIIRRMHDAGEVLRVTQPRANAVAKKPDIAEKIKALEARAEKEPKRDPYRVESMRYYAAQAQRVTGAPMLAMYQDLIDTKNTTEKTRHARMAALETAVPGFKEIAGDEQALQPSQRTSPLPRRKWPRRFSVSSRNMN